MTQPTLPLTQSESHRNRMSKTAGYYIAFVVLGLSAVSLGPTLPGLAEQTSTTLSQVSFLFAARSLGYLLGAVLGGRLYDRLQGQKLMAAMLLVMGATLAVVPGISMLWLLAGVLLLMGLGEGALDVGGNTLIVWVHREKVSPYMNGLHFFFGVGAFLSPIIFAQAILLTGGIAWGYRLLAFLVLPVALYTFLQPSPSHQGRAEDGTYAPLKATLLLPVVIFFFLTVGVEAGFGGWVYTYSRQLNLDTEVTAAYLTSAYWGALTIGRLIGIPLSIRFRPKTLILGDLIGCLVSLAVIIAWHDSRTALWVGSMGLGFSIASLFPNTINFTGEHMTITGKITSLFFVGSSLGGMFFPWFIGQLIEPLGTSSLVWLLVLLSFLSLGVYAWMIVSARRVDMQP